MVTYNDCVVTHRTINEREYTIYNYRYNQYKQEYYVETDIFGRRISFTHSSLSKRKTFEQAFDEFVKEVEKAVEKRNETIIETEKLIISSDDYDKYKGKWTSIKESLPPKDTNCLVFPGDSGRVSEAVFLGSAYRDGSPKFMDGEQSYSFDATHWMPLPEPPIID